MSTVTWAPQAVPADARRCAKRSALSRDSGERQEARYNPHRAFSPVPVGLKGILHTEVVKARRDLPEDERVKHVYEEKRI